MISSVPSLMPHLAPTVAYGIPPLRGTTDTLCRRELADLIDALCQQVHGGRQPCSRCAAVA